MAKDRVSKRLASASQDEAWRAVTEKELGRALVPDPSTPWPDPSRRADVEKALREPKLWDRPARLAAVPHLIIHTAHRLRLRGMKITRAMEVCLLVLAYRVPEAEVFAGKKTLTRTQQAKVQALLREYRRKFPAEQRKKKKRTTPSG